MEIFVGSYTEEGYQPIPSLYNIFGAEYARGLQCFVPASTDAVPIDLNNKIIYLARRRTKPMAGWWWIGGKMLPHETKEESLLRSFKRETGLELSISRFKLVAVLDYRWKDRAQIPQDIGCHMMAYTFTVELSRRELEYAALNLEKDEYEKGCGLTPFDRAKLVSESVFPAILEFYDHIFERHA